MIKVLSSQRSWLANVRDHVARPWWGMFLLAFTMISLKTPLQLCAQDYDHFRPLECVGDIPEELRIAASKKYAQELAALGDSAKGREGRARDNFLLQSNFVLDDMLLSGRVLFGDPVSEYITRVKNFILRDQPELQREIRIYLVKSPVVNAFATNSGILLVNMGLIAHLKTEAELAFVLCHEIQHYIHKHPINNYVNAENLKSNAKLLGLNTSDDYVAERNRYSRTLELDADASGFDLYSKSGYALSAAEGVFELLAYAEQPFDQMAWDASTWEWEYLRFPARFSTWPIEPIAIDEGDDDTLSTHPNIAKRRAVIANRIANATEDNGAVFMIGVDLFLDARKRCRFELCDLLLSNHCYEEAIYNCHLLQAEEPESHYLKKVTAQALYGLSTYKNARRFSEAHLDADDHQGELQQLIYFIEMGDGEFLNVVAVHEAWKTYLADTTDHELQAVAAALLEQLFQKHRSTTEWLAHEKPAAMPPRIDSLLETKMRWIQSRGDTTAVEVVEESENEEDDEGKEKDSDVENNFLEWALTDLFADDRFADAWAAQIDIAAQIDDETYHSAHQLREMTRRERLRGIHLGIDKIVLVQPIYKSVDRRDEIPVQYIASEASLETYKEILAEMATRNDVKYEFLENRNLEVGDVGQFNDVSTMLLWFGDHLNGSDDKIHLVNFRQDEANAIIERFGTKYFAWNALIQVTDRMDSWTRMSWLAVGCGIFPLLPLAIYKIAKPLKTTLLVTLVFDLERSEAIWEDYRILKANDQPAAVRSIMYDKFSQIH